MVDDGDDDDIPYYDGSYPLIDTSKGTVKCNACNTPVSHVIKCPVKNEHTGKYEEQLWCIRCVRKGPEALKQKEQGR